MSLRDDLLDSIRKGLGEVYPLHDEESFGETAVVILDYVWGVLEDVVGSAQEALFQQLTAVRTELDASRRREDALRETVRNLSQQESEEPGDS